MDRHRRVRRNRYTRVYSTKPTAIYEEGDIDARGVYEMMVYKLRDGRPTPKVMRVRAHRLDDVRVPLFSDDESVDFQPVVYSFPVDLMTFARNRKSDILTLTPFYHTLEAVFAQTLTTSKNFKIFTSPESTSFRSLSQL